MAKVSRERLPEGGRVLVVSDIHGNLDYFTGLLKKCRFGSGDTLIIDGDFLEKGPDSLGTLRLIMRLMREGDVRAVCGNCDCWFTAVRGELGRTAAEHIGGYIRRKPQSFLAQLSREAGIDPEQADFLELRQELLRRYAEEFDFLESLPTVIDTPDYVFVHGGLPEGEPESWSDHACRKFDNFLGCGRSFDRWVVVGHWPVMLYRENIVNANPLIDREKRIASIDGGCVLKDDGQLNALILPERPDGEFGLIAYDRFPTAKVRSAQTASESSYYIRWGDAQVRVLRRGAEFSRIRHLRTGYEMDVLTKYLDGEGDVVTVNDCTDYVLPLEAGDEVSIVETTSRGYFVKHNGISGWYYGQL